MNSYFLIIFFFNFLRRFYLEIQKPSENSPRFEDETRIEILQRSRLSILLPKLRGFRKAEFFPLVIMKIPGVQGSFCALLIRSTNLNLDPVCNSLKFERRDMIRCRHLTDN